MEAYKGSQFNLFIPLEDSGECLTFNTFTSSEVVVDRHLKAIIENGRPPESISPADRSNPEQLKEMGIMVDENVDEDPELEYWRPPTTLRLIYYGGETLLNLPAVNFFSQALHEAAAAGLFFRQDKQDRQDDQDKEK